MQGPMRRVVYVALYEAIAIIAATAGLSALSGQGAAHSGVVAAVSSVIAIVWNVVWNHLFERWEARQATRGRGMGRRIAHALGMEGGLVFMLVPLFAWWFKVSLWEALVMDIGLLLFFLVYTFVFNWSFDRIFGLPQSAQ
ncbi:PACE efflux transporter [Comamonas piscis]|uniref:PACE efflux transporter n=1 Tax=Comamonas piscis TaxID=1562974 RepID=A0A7G5ENJ8_9BURK|nr:PACE efflux transporter [Comamonas piscis]